jgi:tripartite-type tricarboxylate transporter receptor subunit TctC
MTQRSSLVGVSLVLVLCVSLLAGCAGVPGAGTNDPAASYPSKSVTMIVASSPGGATDTAVRNFLPYAQKYLGQSISIENKPGSNSLIGTNYFYDNAKPDGYTLMAANSSVALNSFVYKDSYKPPKQYAEAFEFVYAWLTGAGNGVVVLKDSPFKTIEDLTAEAKKRPLTVAIGGGLASADQITVISLQKAYGGQYRLVPVDGSAEAAALIQGAKVDFGLVSPDIPATDPERMRCLAVTMEERSPKFPTCQTFKELGKPSLMIVEAIGAAVPLGTPPAIVKKITDAFAKARSDPEYIAWSKQANQPIGSSGWDGPRFRQFMIDYSAGMGQMLPLMEQQLKEAQQ